jgi:hypothetical protein
MAREAAGKDDIGKLNGAEEPTDEAEDVRVQVRPLALPLRQHAIDVIRRG